MASAKITINGQQYDSPEAMPPDVRRTYEEAMRMVGPTLASEPSDGRTQILTGRAGLGIGGSLVVNRTTTVNEHTYGSVDELPPDVRKMYEDALQGSSAEKTRPKTSVHLSVNVGEPETQRFGDLSGSPTSAPLPIEQSTLESRIRNIPVSLAILVVVGLILWVLLGR